METRGQTALPAIYKLFFALLGLSAVATEIVTLVSLGRFVPANFFSYFTILSNLIAAGAFGVGAYALLRRRPGRRIDALRGAAALYMGLTGIVFAVLLAGLDPSVLTAVPWDNSVLHYIIPVAAVLDWVLDKPSAPVTKRTMLAWLAFPLAYLAYTLLRGPFADWYPYPFIDPRITGYGPVLVTCAVITAGVVLGALVIRARSLAGRAAGRETPADLV